MIDEADVQAQLTIAQRLEKLPVNARLGGIVARISAGGWFEFYDLFMSAYISLGMIKSGLYAAVGAGFASFAAFAACGFAGMFVGTLLFGWVSDRFGRKATFTWSMVFYSIMTAAMALAPSAPAIDALRLLAGIGIGVQIVTIDAYISEIAPKASRGRLIALSQAITYTAVPVVALLANRLVPHVFAGMDGWRLVALGGALGAIFVWPIRADLAESPRWLQSRGREREAAQALAQIELRVGVHDSSPPARDTSSPGGATPSAVLRRILNADYRSRTLMLVAFNIFQTIGFYGFAIWVPLLLYKSGVTFIQSLNYTFIIAMIYPLGPILAMRYADAIERKFQIVALAAASAVFGLAFAHAHEPWAIIAFGTLITLANTWFSCAFHTYQSELYPTHIRASAIGFVYSWSRLSSIFVGYLCAFILKAWGAPAAFQAIAFAMVISATIVALFGPQTNRKQLEVLAP